MSDKICSSADKVLEVFLENAPTVSYTHLFKQIYNGNPYVCLYRYIFRSEDD